MVIYLTKLRWAIPLLLIFGFIPPGPVDIKIQASIAILVVLLIPQLVSVLLVFRNERKRYARDVREAYVARLHPPEDADTDTASLSRKEQRRRARIAEIQNELVTCRRLNQGRLSRRIVSPDGWRASRPRSGTWWRTLSI